MRRFRQIGLALAGALLLVPFWGPVLWLILASLWPDNQPLAAIWLTPENFSPSLNNYRTAAELVPLGRFGWNSVRVVAVAVPLTVLVASLAGFGLTRLPPKEQAGLIWLSLAALLAPPTALWLARFPVFKALGWVDTLAPLIVPALLGGSPFFVLLCFWATRRLPPALLEAAVLEGASLWQVWWWVVLPLTRNTLAGVFLLAFVLFWGNFTDPLLYLRSEMQMTLPIGLRLLEQLDRTRWPVLMAGSVVLTAPVLLVFWLGQRWFWHTWNLPPRRRWE